MENTAITFYNCSKIITLNNSKGTLLNPQGRNRMEHDEPARQINTRL